MKNAIVPIIGLGIVLIIGLMVGVGYAIDASDGSIDAFDDQKWEATGNDGKIEVGDAPYDGSLVARQDAYDFGVAVLQNDSSSCPVMVQGHDQAVALMNAGTDATSYLTKLQTFTNDWVTDKATSAGYTVSDSKYAVSGWWDELARTCPEALFNPTIAGRP